jgi:uncharacterized membrane protein
MISNTQYKLLKTALIIFLIDLFWLGSGGIYARAIAEKIQGSPLELRYIVFPIIYLFLAYMVLETTSYKQAFLYGVSIYGVYDFTTLALFKDYDWKFALADTLWGGLLFVFTKYMLQAF